MSRDWSVAEVRATIADYMAMYRLELSGQAYNKTAHARRLMTLLDGRSRSAVEMKHSNISAILRALGHPGISGYKPRGNYQELLAREVVAWLESDTELDRFSLQAVERMAATPEDVDFSAFRVSPPSRQARDEPRLGENSPLGSWRDKVALKRDYAAREARNASLGLAGEELVVKFEQFRLGSLGLDRLAGKVEHVSKTQGDGLGFDVLSFEPDGREKYLEVKTTAFARETPFFATANELRFSRDHADRYALFRLFEFRGKPQCFVLEGEIDRFCQLDPVTYRCSFG
ncbi:MAG: DUF3883 domain-containing protein [Verrucomicrobia bacterium]|nr:DUF3883 domain-containing protein [Verrucomicrobiota bacterium]